MSRHDPVTISDEAAAHVRGLLEKEIDVAGTRTVAFALRVSPETLDDMRDGRRSLTFRHADMILVRLLSRPELWHLPPLDVWFASKSGVMRGVRLINPGRHHKTPCSSCGVDPDLRTVGCQACTNRAYRRRRLNGGLNEVWAA